MNTTSFVFKNFSKTFRKYKKMKNSKYEIKNIEKKYLNIMQKNPLLRINNGLLEKDFIELEERELRDKKVKIKRELEEHF